ncbi:MAG: hypothetical protein ACRCWM_00545 [Sarcina sp.]
MLIKVKSYSLTSSNKDIVLILSDNSGTLIDLTDLDVTALAGMLAVSKMAPTDSVATLLTGSLTYSITDVAPANGELKITLPEAVTPASEIIYIKQGSAVIATAAKTSSGTITLGGIINTASINETLKGDGTTATSNTKMLAGIGTDQKGTDHKLVIRLISADGTAISSEEVTLATSFSINGTDVAYINLVTNITEPVISNQPFNFTVTYYNAANEPLTLLDTSTAAITAYLKRA